MHRFCALLLAAFLVAVWHAPASASADYGCYPSWKLAHSSLSDCDNIALLGPGNDTRVNLVMLLVDLRGGAERRAQAETAETPQALFDWRTFKTHFSPQEAEATPTSFSEGEGSRCRSNVSGTEAFEAAIRAARKLRAGEGEILIGVRRAIQPTCAGKTPGDGEIAEMAGAIQSRDGLAFEAYLRGTLAFYDGDFDTATKHFSSLRNASLPWLKETARYMLARVAVNRAQIGVFDEYGDWEGPERADQTIIDAAEAALLRYIEDYPNGLYTKSARGLLRRVYWLGGRTEKLVAQYIALFALDPGRRGISDAELADEIDNKLLSTLKPGETSNSILIAVIDLMRMRSCDGCNVPQITLAELEGQRRHFAADPALFDYLLAAHAFYVSNKPDEVLRLISKSTPRRSSYLEFSRQVLLRMAMAKLGKIGDANAWLDLLPGAALLYQRPALELALALHHERGKTLGRVFEAGSPIQVPVLREILLTNVADARLLRAQAKDRKARPHERDVALFTLLYKELSRGAYRDFLADLALVPAGASAEGGGYYDLIGMDRVPVGIFASPASSQDFDCPPLRQTVARLSGNPGEIKARLCLGDFMRLNGFDYHELDKQPPADELGGTPTLFAAKPYSRLEVYKSIIADPKAAAPEKAYALYRAVHCYGPTGNNSCGGTEVPLSQRRSWFNRLKKDYPNTEWARTLKYYW